jgi:outer membrane protein insertion porin family
MRKKRSLAWIFVLVLCLNWTAPAIAKEPDMLIGKIAVENNRRIETSTILDRITTKPGDRFDPKTLRKDLKSIYATGFFKDIKIDAHVREGKLVVTFLVDEKPFIREIEIKGNEELETDKIMKEMTLETNSIYDRKAVAENAELIRDYYREEGWYLAKVTPKIETISEDWVKVIYDIEEGKEVRIRKIEFEGNENFDDDKLADQMETVEYWWFSWLTGSGHLEKEEFNKDIERLLDFYFNNGYIKAVVGTPQIKIGDNQEDMFITIPITEGGQYKIGHVGLEGNRIYTDKELFDYVSLKPGEIFDRSQLRSNINLINDAYASKGYLLTDVYPVVTSDDINKTADITITINEGKIVYTNFVNISGNDHTIDKVIRREVRVQEGDVLTSTAIRRSHERIQRLGFFEEVGIKTTATETENDLNLDISVKERLTGAFSIGAGWSSVDKLVGTVKLTQGNLFGRGQNVSVQGTFGDNSQSVVLSFFEPYVADTLLSGGIDVFYRARKSSFFTPYNIDRWGGSLPISYPLGEFWRIYNTYRYQTVIIYNADDNASDTVRDREGMEVTSSDTLALTRDSRDSRLVPTRGSKNRASVEYAGGALGGDHNFLKYLGQSSWFLNPFWKVVANMSGRIGFIQGYDGDEIPLEELFAVGGANTVRGYSFRQIGPQDEDTVIGGDKYLIFNLEFRIPVVDVLALAFFVDSGNAWAEGEDFNLRDMRSGAGAGFRMFTPIGPIKLDWGYKLGRRKDEDPYEWHFSMGTYF